MNTLFKIKMMALLAGTLCVGFDWGSAKAEGAKCGKRDALVTMLKKRYKEVPVGLGISQKNTEAFEIFVSEKGTWTVTMTMSNGLTCVMAVGHSWQKLPAQVAESVI